VIAEVGSNPEKSTFVVLNASSTPPRAATPAPTMNA